MPDEPISVKLGPPNLTPALPDGGHWTVSNWPGWAHSDAFAPFAISFTAQNVGGEWGFTRLEITCAPRPGEDLPPVIRPATLRHISITALLDAVKAEAIRSASSAIEQHGASGRDPEDVLAVATAAIKMHRATAPKRRIPRLTDDYLRQVAVMRVALNDHPKPVAEMARRLGYSQAAISQQLNKATEQGWLMRAAGGSEQPKRGARRRLPGPRLLSAEARSEPL